MKNILITACKTPDIDGVACAIAYKSFLQQQDVANNYYVAFQDGIHIEGKFVIDTLWIPCKELGAHDRYDNFILVDMSERGGMPDAVNLDKVIEIIDHRSFPDYAAFPNAAFRVEPVWAAATQIAEFFYFNQQIKLDPKIAQLLLCAIYSNTVNFKADVTTFRDERMRDWLQTFVEDKELFMQMFDFKTHYVCDNLRQILVSDLKEMPEKKFTIFQIEVNDSAMILARQEEITSIMKEISADITHAILIIQDIQAGKTTILSRDKQTAELMGNAWLPWIAHGLLRQIDNIMMRKSIIPYIKK